MILLSLFSGCILLLFSQTNLFADSYTFRSYGRRTSLFKASSQQKMARNEPPSSPESGYEDKKKVGQYIMRNEEKCELRQNQNLELNSILIFLGHTVPPQRHFKKRRWYTGIPSESDATNSVR
jgi:hypothetical protein